MTYEIDARDRVVMLRNVPPCDCGASRPIVVQDEGVCVVAFALAATAEPRGYAVIRFGGVRATYFGSPNDEAFAGHPLASRGLTPYAAAEVLESSWIRALARRNAVHPMHDEKLYARDRHFVLSFHDSLFECIARDYETERVTSDQIGERLVAITRALTRAD